MREATADIAVIGGGIGGCMAAYSALTMGKKVILTEETDWIGGQLTAQAVPPDEHPWIEDFGCTSTYRKFRNQVRQYYFDFYPVTEKARREQNFNPGNAWVSRIAHEPRVALNVLHTYFHPFVSNGQLTILLNHKPAEVSTSEDQVDFVAIESDYGIRTKIVADYFLDATEMGDLLPLADMEYFIGAESKEMTGETHALNQYLPQDIQSFTWVYALEHCEGENHVIEKPEMYEEWKEYQAGFLNHKQLSWSIPEAATGESKSMQMFNDKTSLGLWEYRRIIDASYFDKGFYKGDISLINWPQNDYWGGPIVDVSYEVRKKNLNRARQLSLSLLYWLQTEAPRAGGGTGYPGLRLRPDITGTSDGLAKQPYIRESRRIKALHHISEQDINAELPGAKRKTYEDSVGIGAYRMDLHPTTETNQLFYSKSFPFEIPLGSLIPERMKNLLPACKNVGSTHLTNGCMRVHPVEWNIGESAGALAAFALDTNKTPIEIYRTRQLTSSYQQKLRQLGIQLHWPQLHLL